MATTTPNFGWPVPTSTDLVKDGATAIEALGDGIDTSMVDLKGGTTGQILAKATSADMDFAWITNDVGDITAVTAGTGISGGGTSGAVTITNSMATEIAAKGDLIVGTGSATFDNLTVGANGETLVADSSTSTGLRYTAGTVQENPILNSAMQVWQRGTSFTIASSTLTYTADRWAAYRTATGLTVSRQATGDTTNLPNIQYCTRISRDSGNTSTAVIDFAQSMESVNSIPYAGKTVTVSFYARKGANYSPTTSYVVLKTGTGTDQNVLSGFTGAVNAVLANPTFTTTWARYTYTATLDANITQIGFYLDLTPVGTAGAADYLEATGFQIDVGSVALPFRTNGATIQGELAACQRYYYRATCNSAYSYLSNSGYGSTTTIVFIPYALPVPLRVYATTLETTANLSISDTQTRSKGGTFALDASGSIQFPLLKYTHGSAVFTQYRPYGLQADNDATVYVAFGAEL